MTEEYRLCIVETFTDSDDPAFPARRMKTGYFHGWYRKKGIPMGLVELEDGRMVYEDYGCIRFSENPVPVFDVEAHADLEHEIWSHWMHYLFSKMEVTMDGMLIPQELVDRWYRQMETEYKDLSEEEKQSDRDQVYKHIDLLKGIGVVRITRASNDEA
jgi:hypothetical protein